MTDTTRVYIGYDPRQPVAYQVLAHSVWRRASQPVAITRLQLSQLGHFTRRGLTEFTFSRFLTPYLSNYEGHSVFLDSDMLCLGDITDLVALTYAMKLAKQPTPQPGKAKEMVADLEAKQVQPPAVWVVMHERAFERPSMMVFNNAACRKLTPDWVQDEKNNPFDIASWAGDNVGALPKEWNHLVGYDQPNPKAKLVHFTMGVPCRPETLNSEFAEEWAKEAAKTVSTVSFKDLMGKSVHVPFVKAGALEGAKM